MIFYSRSVEPVEVTKIKELSQLEVKSKLMDKDLRIGQVIGL